MSRTGGASPKAWPRYKKRSRPEGRPRSEAGSGGGSGLECVRNSAGGVERRFGRLAERDPDVRVLLALPLHEAIARLGPGLRLVVEIVEREFAGVGAHR